MVPVATTPTPLGEPVSTTRSKKPTAAKPAEAPAPEPTVEAAPVEAPAPEVAPEVSADAPALQEVRDADGTVVATIEQDPAVLAAAAAAADAAGAAQDAAADAAAEQAAAALAAAQALADALDAEAAAAGNVPPSVAPLEAPAEKVTVTPPSPDAPYHAVSGTGVALIAQAVGPVIFDDRTGGYPDPEALFSPLTENGTIMRCNVRLIQRLPNGIEQLLLPIGAQVTIPQAESVKAKVAALRAQAEAETATDES